MQTVNQNTKYIEKRIQDSIEWNAWRADQLVSKTTTVVTKVCHEWALSKFHQLHQLIETKSMSKKLIHEVLTLLLNTEELKQVLQQIAKTLQSSFEEYNIAFPTGILQTNLTLDYKRSEKYWLELSRTLTILDLAEEVKQNCWSITLGNFQGWFVDYAIADSGNCYSRQQSDLKVLLLKQISGILNLVEQRITNHLLDHSIREIYRQFDQREQHLRQSLHTLQHTDLFAQEIEYNVC